MMAIYEAAKTGDRQAVMTSAAAADGGRRAGSDGAGSPGLKSRRHTHPRGNL